MTSSIDWAEIKKFSLHTDQWWDEKGPYRLLHRINPIRLKYIRQQIEKKETLSTQKPYQAFSILDIGCGGGILCAPLARLGAAVTGIDAVEGNIEAAKQYAQRFSLDISYHCSTVEQWITTQPPAYDVIIVFELLEHVLDPRSFLEHCLTLLKPSGLLITSTLNRTFLSYALGILAAEHLLRWVPAGTHEWQKFLKPSEIGKILTEQSCVIEDITGLHYQWWKDQWCLGNSYEINYFLTASKA